MAGHSLSRRHRRPAFVMTVYLDGDGVWLFRLKSLRDGREQIVKDIQALLKVLEARASEDAPAGKESHAEA